MDGPESRGGKWAGSIHMWRPQTSIGPFLEWVGYSQSDPTQCGSTQPNLHNLEIVWVNLSNPTQLLKARPNPFFASKPIRGLVGPKSINFQSADGKHIVRASTETIVMLWFNYKAY